QDRLKPWIQGRLLRVSLTAVLLIVAIRLDLTVAAILTVITFLGLELAARRLWLPSSPWRHRVVEMAAFVAVFAAAGGADNLIKRRADDGTKVYLIVTLSDRPIPEESLIATWKLYSAALAEVLD